MMNGTLPVVAVFDKKTGLYDNPFTVRHVAEAIRSWDIVRKDENTKFGKHPEDFDLIQVGNFDCSTARFENLSPQVTLSAGV